MPVPYAANLGRLGRTLGGAAGFGGGILAGGLLGDALDYPRQALANLFSGDLEKMLPGLIGLGAGAGALATGGVGLPAAIGIGSLAGGLGQGIAKAEDPEKFEAPTREDVAAKFGLDRDNPWTTFAMGALTDPLTYAGGLGLEKVGSKALGSLGEKLGTTMEELAPNLQPYSQFGWYGKLRDMMEQVKSHPYFEGESLTSRRAFNPYIFMGQDPDVLKAIAGEAPRGAKLLDIGTESAAFLNPQSGGVFKMTMPQTFTHSAYEVPEMLQQTRRLGFGDPKASGPVSSNMGIITAHEPRVIPATQLGDLYANKAADLEAALNARGLDPWDIKHSNAGFDPATGQLQIIDPGAVTPLSPLPPGVTLPPTQATPSGFPSGRQPQGFLEKYLMAPFIRRDIRRELAEQVGRDPAAMKAFIEANKDAATPLAGALTSSPERKIAELEARIRAEHGLGPNDPLPAQFAPADEARLNELVPPARVPTPIRTSEREMMENPPGLSTLDRLQRGGEGGGPSSAGGPPVPPLEPPAARTPVSGPAGFGAEMDTATRFKLDRLQRLSAEIASEGPVQWKLDEANRLMKDIPPEYLQGLQGGTFPEATPKDVLDQIANANFEAKFREMYKTNPLAAEKFHRLIREQRAGRNLEDFLKGMG